MVLKNLKIWGLKFVCFGKRARCVVDWREALVIRAVFLDFGRLCTGEGMKPVYLVRHVRCLRGYAAAEKEDKIWRPRRGGRPVKAVLWRLFSTANMRAGGLFQQ